MNNFYEFETFRIDVKKRQVWKNGENISIKPKTFDTLLALLKSKNELISKDDLIDEIWNGDAVSDDSLTQQISQLRKLLGESVNENKFIVTVPGVGYKFVADVQEVQSPNGDNLYKANQNAIDFKSENIADKIVKSKTEESQQSEIEDFSINEKKSEKSLFKRKEFWVLGIIFVSVLVGTGLYFWQKTPPKKTTVLGVSKIAVLPFRTISNDDETNSLKQGMTDSLITRLSRIEKLSVIPSAIVAKYEKSEKSPLEFGKEIGVDSVLDGTINRDKNQFVVNIQLFSVNEGKVLWSDSFQTEFTDILETQRLIAFKITQALSLELSDDEKRSVMKKYTSSAEAYRLFLDANYIQDFRKNKEARILAENYYERAIKIDPNFAMAYVNLANLQLHSPSVKAYLKMKVLSQQALEIDPELGEAHSTLGFSIWRGEWNWKDSEEHLKKAVKSSPHDFGTFGTYSMILVGQGKFDEALKVNSLEKTQSEITKTYKVAIYFFKHDFDNAIKLCLEKLEKNPKSIGALSYLAPAYSFKGQHEKAIETAEKYAALDETAGVGSLVYLSLAYIKDGKTEKGKEILRQILDKDAPDSAQIHGGLAMLYGELGEKDKAFEHLEKSIENREWWAFTLKVAPYYDSLRDDKRFYEMLKKVNLAN